MAFIKFNRSSTKAAATSTAAKTDNTVYFPTDEKAIYLNGQKYGENLGLTQTPAQVQTLLNRVDGMAFVACSSSANASNKLLPDSVKLVDNTFIAVQFIYGNTHNTPRLVTGLYSISISGYIKWNAYAKVIFYIKDNYAYVLNSVIEGLTSTPAIGDNRLITSSGVYNYSAPRLIIQLNNYVDDITSVETVVSQSINMTDDSGMLDTWRGMIGRGASPQIVIDLDSDGSSLYINSVVVENTWYTDEDNYIKLSFYLDDRYVNLTFYVPSDDPGGGS